VNARKTANPAVSLQGDASSKPRGIQRDFDAMHAGAERVFKTLVLVVCAWSLMEAPLELGVSDAPAGLAALLVSKFVVVGSGVAAVAKARFARETFTFLCGASVLAIAPALPMEFNRSIAIAVFSSIECFSKAACVIAFGVASSRIRQSRR
jgi:hypothetical protein